MYVPASDDEEKLSDSDKEQIMHIFFELYESYTERVAAKKKSFEAYEFERSAGGELYEAAKLIYLRTWESHGYHAFPVYHPYRIINAPPYVDRVVHDWLVNKYIKPFIEPKLHPGNVACRDDKGNAEAEKLFENMIRDGFKQYGMSFYIMRLDMEGYFDNLSHNRIKTQFFAMEELGYFLLCKCIDSWHYKDSYAANESQDENDQYGITKGCLPSQWMGICYLNDVDWAASRFPGCIGYMRFQDDVIAAFDTKRHAQNCKRWIENYLKENHYGIRLNTRKSSVMPITKGVNIIGWRYDLKPSGKLLKRKRQDRKREQEKNNKSLVKQYAKGKISWYKANQKMQGRIEYLKNGDTYFLRRYYCRQYVFQRNEGVEPNYNPNEIQRRRQKRS